MDKIEKRFNEYFSQWGIYLPPEDIAQRRRGKIVQAGWAIWYLFGADEKGEYLDYYSSHRMTDDSHVRLYANGLSESLPSIRDMRIAAKDPKEDARLDAEFYAENRRIAAMLAAKGFSIQGDEPGGVQINTYLRLNKLPPKG